MKRDILYQEIWRLTENYKSKEPLDRETYIKGLNIIMGYLFLEINLSIESKKFWKEQKESIYRLDEAHLKEYKRFLESLHKDTGK